MSRPMTDALPALGWRKPSSSRIVVDLPAPFGPRKPKISPSRTSIERSSSARTSGAGCIHGGWTGGVRWPYRLDRPEVVIATIVSQASARRGPARGRSAGAWRASGDRGGGGHRVMTNSSIATGRPLPTTVIVIVWLATCFHERWNSVARGSNRLRRRSTVATTLPSIAILAVPRVGPTGPIHATDFA